MFNWFKPKPKPKAPTQPSARSASKPSEGKKAAAPAQAVPPTADELMASEVAAARELCITRAASATAVMRMWLREDDGSQNPQNPARSGAKLH
jgi:hypothetical protein